MQLIMFKNVPDTLAYYEQKNKDCIFYSSAEIDSSHIVLYLIYYVYFIYISIYLHFSVTVNLFIHYYVKLIFCLISGLSLFTMWFSSCSVASM
jgi:hypothetical protein